MSDRPSVYSRIQRRETHSSRAVPAIVLAVVLILALAYFVTEVVLAAFGQRPLLASPEAMVQGIAAIGTLTVAVLAIAGAVLALLGLLLLVLALRTGRRARHVLHDDRAVVVIDDEVIASALVRAAADGGNLDPDRTVGQISRRTATLRVTPSSGMPVDRDAVDGAVKERLQKWGLKPALRSRVRIEKAGKVGA